MSGNLVRDLRLGLRSLGRNWTLSAVIVLSLALGLGAATTVFVFVDKILLEPLPVHEPDRLAAVFGITASSDRFLQTSYPNYEDFRDRNTVFSGLLACQWIPLNLTGGDRPEQIVGQIVSSNYFEVLGVRPALGRGFTLREERPGVEPVIVLGHDLWRRRFGADPRLVGQTIEVNGRRFTVAGIAPEGFRGRGRIDPTEAWVPMGLHEAVFPFSEHVADRGWGLFYLLGRLRPGVSHATADAALKTIAAQLAREHPEENGERGAAVLPVAESAAIDPATTRTYRRVGRLFSAAGALLLLIACANAANLLLVRARHRRLEIAVRLALGAPRWRLIRQMLAESTPLFLLAGVAALPLAALGRTALLRVRSPFWAEASVDLTLDGRVLAFAIGAALLTALLFGLWPALRASGTAPGLALGGEEGSRSTGRSGASQFLVVLQIGLSLVSLILAGLFVRSFRQAQAVEPGFDTERLAVLSFEPGALGFGREQGLELARQVTERVRGVPGVEGAAIGGNLLLSPVVVRRNLSLAEGEGALAAGEEALIAVSQAGPGYFETLGIALREGRTFTPADREGAPPVAVINESLARRLWPDRSAVGRRLLLSGEEGAPPVEVVGVVEDTRQRSLTEEPEPHFYLPLFQDYSATMNLYVRSAGEPAALLKPVSRVVQEVAPRLPINNPQTVEQLVAGSLLTARTGYVVLALFGGTALLLALGGTYGAVSDWVSRRRREIAIRSALGATPRRVTQMILAEVLRLVAVGVASGVAGALALQRLVAGMLHGVSPVDPATYTMLALLVVALSLLAALVPARRIAVNPPAGVLR